MKKHKPTQITDELTWWLSKKGFNLNNEYRIDLIWIDKKNNSAKIKITNLKTKISEEVEVNND